MSDAQWRLQLTRSAQRDLNELPEKAAGAIFDALEAISDDPRRLGKPLQLELEGQYAARRGPYRILYEIDDESRSVRVVAIGHRSDVYRRR